MLGVGRFGPTGPRSLMDEERAPAPGEDVGGPALSRSGPAGVAGGSGTPAGPGEASAELLAVVASAEGIGPVTLERLLDAFGNAAAVLDVARRVGGQQEIIAATRTPDGHPSITPRAVVSLVEAARAPEQVLAQMRAAGVHAVALGDPVYPSRLRLIELPPRVLFVRGADAALGAAHAVAVVGTRRPTIDGRRVAARIGAALARAGAVVISGLAVGVDGAAHAAVVEEGGCTAAVIGGGHARLSPGGHDRLADAIVAGGGAIVSEHAPGVTPTRGTFPRRNRVISGLADAVVVVEAGATSGALLTAAWALEQGRECFLVPGQIDAPQSAGCLAWLRDFAGVTRVVAGVPQLLEDLGLDGAAAYPAPGPARRTAGALMPSDHSIHAPSAEAVALDLPEREGRIVRGLAAGAHTADELAAVTGIPIGAVLAGLTALETRGLVVGAYGRYEVPDRVFRRGPARRDPAA